MNLVHLLIAAACAPGPLPQAAPAGEARAALRFEEARADHGAGVRWVGRVAGTTITVRDAGFDLWLRDTEDGRFHQLRLDFEGSAGTGGIEPQQPRGSRASYFVGADPAEWRTGLGQYARLVHREVWPGIDVVLRPDGARLAFDLVVGVGARPDDAVLSLRGAELELAEDGRSLSLAFPGRTLRLAPPRLFQRIGDQCVPVDGEFRLLGEGRLGFSVGDYDVDEALVIDPTFVASTLFGGGSLDEVHGVDVDAAGNVYLTGMTTSPDLPLGGAFQGSVGGLYDAFVAKLDPSLSQLLYCSYLGGTGDFGWYERAVDIAVDDQGAAVVVGRTDSGDFPVLNAYQPTFGGQADAFVAKVSPQGDALLWSTYLGGSGFEQDTEGDFFVNRTGDVAVDELGRVFVVGTTESLDLPVLAPYQAQFAGDLDAFVASFEADGSARFVSYFGGSGRERGWALDLDRHGEPMIGGLSFSPDLPLGVDAWQQEGEGFLSHFSADGQILRASSHVPLEVRALAVGRNDRVAFTGTSTDRCLPTTWGATQPEHAGSVDAHPFELYVGQLDLGLSELHSATYHGSNVRNETGEAIVVDPHGGVWVAGTSAGHRGSTTSDALSLLWNEDLSALVDVARFGGRFTSAFAAQLAPGGELVLAGTTSSTGFPTTAGAFQTSLNGTGDGFVSLLRASAGAVLSLGLENTKAIPGASLQGRANLDGRAPVGGASVSLLSSDASVSVPASVHVAEGDTSVVFPISVSASAPLQVVRLDAQYGTGSATVDLEVWSGPRYRLEFLGSLGGNRSNATGINSRGEIALTGLNPNGIDRALLLDEGGQLVNLGLGFTGRIADSGQIAIERNGKMARYTPGVGIETLGTLPGGRLSSGAAVNSSGQVVGWSEGSGIQQHAVRHTEGVGMEDLGTLGGDLSQANDINDAGQVAGYSFLAGNGAYRAFRHSDGVGLLDLGVLPGMAHSFAWGINEAGQVVGESSDANLNQSRAFRYTDGVGLEDLGGVPGAERTVPRAIDRSGNVVGTTRGSGAVGPVLYTPGTGWQVLAEAIDPRELFGWSLGEALDLNDDGVIVGVGDLRANDCNASAFRLVPCTASWNNYGAGWPGTLGVPALVAGQEPVLGQPLQVTLGNSRGAATPTFLLLGFRRTELSLGSGAVLLVEPSFSFRLALAAGGATLGTTLPDDPALHGAQWYLQSMVLDPGAAGSIALSPGLRLNLGTR